MNSPRYLAIEFFVIFFLIPISFAVNYWVALKAAIALLGLAYILYILFRKERIKLNIKRGIRWKHFLKRLVVTFVIVAIVTTAFVWWQAPESLFYVPMNKPELFIFILFVYTFLSVWPQELIYRTFYFKRYEGLFKSKSLFIFVNAIAFSLAHIFFRNTLVMVLTFIGGILFAWTYLKFRSTTMVSIEHALYGNWLFTVGMGEMLAFPGMEGAG